MIYDIVFAVGQSHVAGAATDYTSADQYPAGIYMYDHATGTIVPAAEPQSTPIMGTAMGATNTFLKDYAANFLPSGRALLIVNVAWGGTGFTLPSSNPAGTGYHWRYDRPDDSFNLARRAVATMLTVLAIAGPGSRIVAVLANHGSTDGTNKPADVTAADWKPVIKGYLTAWINWMRDQLDIPTVPYVMMQMRPSLIAAEPRHKAVDDAAKEVAAELPYAVHVPSPTGSTYEKSTDAVHFNALGYRTIGHSLYTAWEPLATQFGGKWSDIWSDTWGGAVTLTRTGTFELTLGAGATWGPKITRTAGFHLALGGTTTSKPGRRAVAAVGLTASAVGVVRYARTANAALTLSATADAGETTSRRGDATATLQFTATHKVKLTRTATAVLTANASASRTVSMFRVAQFDLTVQGEALTSQRQSLDAAATLTLGFTAESVVVSDYEERTATAVLLLAVAATSVVRLARTAQATLTLTGHATGTLRVEAPVYLGDTPVLIRVGETPVVLA